MKKSVVFVGPDRCWKSTLCRMVAHEFNVEPYAGRRGSEAQTGVRLRYFPPTVYDRGIICARAYDVLFDRPARSEQAYDYCEKQMLVSGALYVFLDRDDFSNVNDEKDKLDADDLTKLSMIYKDLLEKDDTLYPVPYIRIVVEDDTGTDPVKQSLVISKILDFIETTGGIANDEE